MLTNGWVSYKEHIGDGLRVHLYQLDMKVKVQFTVIRDGLSQGSSVPIRHEGQSVIYSDTEYNNVNGCQSVIYSTQTTVNSTCNLESRFSQKY